MTHAYPRLARYRPPGRLLSPPLLLSVVLNVCFALIIQVCGFLLVKQQPWYLDLHSHRGCPTATTPVSLGNGTGNFSTVKERMVLSYEGTTLWPLVTINIIIVAFVFSKGKPFRKPIYTNYIYFSLLCVQLGVSLFLLFADIEGVYTGLEILCTPLIWRFYILIMLAVTFCVSFFVEDYILQNRRLWLLIKALFRFRSSSQYQKLKRQLEKDAAWPPVNKTDYAEDRISEAYINPIYERDEED